MNEYDDTDAFDRICGDCVGVDLKKITDKDIRKAAKIWTGDEECSQEMINAAIRAA